MPDDRLQRTRELTPELADRAALCMPSASVARGFVGMVTFDWYRCWKCRHTWRLRSDHQALPNCPMPSCRAALKPWRAPHVNAAEQLTRAYSQGLNSTPNTPDWLIRQTEELLAKGRS